MAEHFSCIFRQGEELCIASWARWDAQLQGLVELERRCQDARPETQVLSARQSKSAMEAQVAVEVKATDWTFDRIKKHLSR